MTYLPPVLQIGLALLVLTAGVYDIRYRRIPNWLVLAGLIFGLALNTFLGPVLSRSVWTGLRHAGLGLGLAFLIYFPLYLLRGMGAGDVKLMAAVGSIVGPGNWIVIFIISALLGGIFAITLSLAKGRLRRTMWNVAFLINEMAHARAPHLGKEELDVNNPKAVTLPHGTVIALGTMLFLGAGHLLVR
jgi:prepilin peptidase CpaA